MTIRGSAAAERELLDAIDLYLQDSINRTGLRYTVQPTPA